MPQRPRRESGSAWRRLAGWAALALAAGAVVHGALILARYGAPLAVVLGAAFTGWLVGVGLAALAVSAAVVACVRGGEQPALGWLPARLAVYVFALGVLTYMLWLLPVRGPLAALHFATCAGVYALTLLAVRADMAPRTRRLLGAADAGLACLLLAALSAELALRAWDGWSQPPLLARPDESAADRIRRNALTPGQLMFRVPVNSLGDHDTELQRSGRSLVVSVGDSFSVGVVPHQHHFTTVAERALEDVEIYNMGVFAIGPDEYLHLIRQRVGALQPDAILVNLFVGNDVTDVAVDHDRPPSAWAWLDPDGWLLPLLARRVVTLARDGTPEGLVPETGDQLTGWTADDPRRAEALATYPQRYPWFDDPSQETPFLAEPAYLELELRRARDVCSPGTSRYASLFDVLAEIEAACGATPWMVMIIPDEFQVEDALWQQIVDATTGEELDRDQPQRLLLDWLSRAGVPSLDLLPVLRAVPPGDDGRRSLYHLRDTHFNVRGNRAAGQALAAFLRQQLR